ncbi:MAG: hypothetical protein R3C45_02115 [Phycisphaerales bacterium]
MNTQHARDSCKAALLGGDHLLHAANDRVCRQADHFGDLNYLLINLAHAGLLLRRACRHNYHGVALRLLRWIDRLSDDLQAASLTHCRPGITSTGRCRHRPSSSVNSARSKKSSVPGAGSLMSRC